MKTSHKIATILLLVATLIPTNLFAAWTLAVFPTDNRDAASYFTFENAGTNVADEMVVYASVSGNWSDYSYYVGVNNQPVASTSADKPLSDLGTSATGRFSLNIYSSQSDKENYYPHAFKVLDATEYTYGMACWVAPITDGCAAGQASSAASHVFTGGGSVFSYEFIVAQTTATFKVLKSADGSTWVWDSGQLGHDASGTVLKVGTGVKGGGSGDCSLNLPGLKSGDKVKLKLIKDGAVYTLSASYIPTPVVTLMGDGCNNIIFRLGKYESSLFTPYFKLNGAEVEFVSNQYQVQNPVRGKKYTMTGYFTDADGEKSEEVSVSDMLPDMVEKPILGVSADDCNTYPAFTLRNPVDGITYTWMLNGTKVTPTENAYTVIAPVSGTTYSMIVKAEDGCTEQTSDAVSRVYRGSPDVPQVSAGTFACDGDVKFTVKNYNPAYSYTWKINNTQVLVSGDTYTVPNPVNLQLYEASVTVSDDGCESTPAFANSAYVQTPAKPEISVNDGCGADVTFTLTNPDVSSYTWELGPNLVSPTGNTYTVANPVNGENYTMNVTAYASYSIYGPCPSAKETKSQMYKEIPSEPTVNNYKDCPTSGSGMWSSLVGTTTAGSSIAWYASQSSAAEISQPADFDKSASSVTSYWAAQKSAQGCVGPRSEVSVTVLDKPVPPSVTNYTDCPTTGTQTWESLISYTGTLRWYVSQTSPTAVANPGEFDKSVSQNKEYWVSQTSADGCESDRVKVFVLIYQKPEPPQVDHNYLACQESGSGKWVDLLKPYTGTLRWYESEESTMYMLSVPDFQKSVVGERSYWVSVVSAEGCESNKTKVTVDVRKTPSVFAGDDRSVCYGATTKLGEEVLDVSDIEYSWEPSALLIDPALPNPTTRAMTQTTIFTVTAFNKSLSTCYSTSTVKVTVVENPILELEDASLPVCSGTSVTFVNKATESDVSYSWLPVDMIQGSTINSSMTTKPLTESQTYTLTAYRKLYPTVPSSKEKCESTVEATAIVVEPPVADAGADAVVCIGSTYKLGMTSVFNVKYEWTPADKVDNPHISNPNTTPVLEDVEYTLTATMAAAPFCQSTDVVKVTKVDKPKKYTVSGDNNYCNSESTAAMIITLNGSDQNTEYALFRNDILVVDYKTGSGSTMKWYDNPAGIYTVKARIIGTDCVEEMDGSATIIARESPTATIINKGTVACPGESTIIQVIFQGEAPFTYRISENGEVKHTGTTDDHVYAYELTPIGNTVIKLETLQDAFCKNTFMDGNNPLLDLEIEALSDFKIHSNQTTSTICPGDKVKLYIDYTGTKTKYQWSTGEQNKRIIYVEPSVTSQYKIYAETDTHCVVEDSITINVASKDAFRIEGLRTPLNYCSSETNVNITGYPTGGSFSADPKEVLVGTNTLDFSKITKTSQVSLTYTYGQQGCVFDTTLVINVSALLTDVDWMVVPDFGPPYRDSYSFCLKTNEEEAKKNYPLQGYPQQKNGFWKIEANQQTGASTNAKITVTDQAKSQAKLTDVSAGTYFITYYVKDEFGCEASKTKNLEIRKDVQSLVDMKGFIYEPNDTVCQKSSSAVIKADNITGTYSMSPSSAIISQSNGVLEFNPSRYKQGANNAIYTIVDEEGCPHNYSAPFVVVAPVNVSIQLSKDTYCSYEDDDVIEISARSKTDGLINIYRCPEGADCNDESSWEIVESVVPVSNPPVFRPTWGAGRYKIVYDYNDGACDWSSSKYVTVYDPTTISMNLLSDYCKGEEIRLEATPSGGFYTAPGSPDGSLINTTFYTKAAGLGVHELTYEVNNEHQCTSRDTAYVLVRGTDNMKIFDLPARLCSPEGKAVIFGFPSPENNDSVYFTGPEFLRDVYEPHDSLQYAEIDYSKANYSTTYNVTYHYVQSYTVTSTGDPATCESTVSQPFRVLNEASDFGGFNHLGYICGDRESVELAANHTKNTTFTFSEAGSPAFKDNGDGTAVIYPKLLSEGMYSVTMNHYFVEEITECTDPDDPTTCVTRLDTVCSSSKSKSFYIERLLDIPQIGLYCKDDNNAIMMGATEPGVKYTLTVNNNYFADAVGDGGPIYYDAIPLDIALCKIEATANGCRYAMSKVIEVEKLKMQHTTQNISCNGQIDGQFQSVVSGGRYPYSHVILDKDAGTVVVKDSLDLHLTPKEYTYTVTDSVGCQRTTDFTITEPDVLTVTIEKQDVNCTGTNTGMLRAMPDGGTVPYSYEWINLDDGSVVGNDATLINVPSGNYKVNITDNNGCTAYATETLIAPQPLGVQVTSVVNVNVIGENTGSIEIEVTGGVPEYKYHWSGNSITTATEGNKDQTELLAGNYYVTVTDDRGCTASTSATVTEPTPFVVTNTIKNVSCNGGVDGYIYITVSGVKEPYTYEWTHPDATTSTKKDVLNVGAGIYHLVINDAIGNKYENDYEVTEPALLTVATTITSNFTEACYGDATANIDIAIEGGTLPYNVTWIGVAPEQITDQSHIKDLAAGTYQVDITDKLGCSTSLTQEITEPAAPLAIESESVTDIVCHGDASGGIDIVVSGGTTPYSFFWTGVGVDPNAQNQSNLNGGKYNVQIKDANGCSINREYTVNEPAELVVDAYGTSLACNGNNKGKVWNITEGGVFPYIFKWTNGAGEEVSSDSIVSQLSAETYTVEVTDKLGCIRKSATTLTEPDELTITTNFTDVQCYGAADGKASVTAQGGTPSYKYAWFKLPDETTPISVESGVTNLEPGVYNVKVSDTNGCSTKSSSITISQPNELQIAYAVSDVTVYGQANGVITTAINGGTEPVEYTWTAGPSIDDTNRHYASLTGVLAGKYYEEVKDANGCMANAVIEVKQPEALIVKETIENAKCNGTSTGSILVSVEGGDGNYSYSWSSDDGFVAITKDILAIPAGQYTLVVTDGLGASVTKSYDVTEPDVLTSELVASGSVLTQKCYADKIGSIKMAYSGGTKPYKVTWNGPDIPAVVSDSSFVSGLGVGEYSVKVVDANGCQAAEFKQTINGPSAPIKIEGVVTNNKCAEENAGSIVLTVTGGTAPYTYSWTGGQGLVVDSKDQSTLYSGSTYRVEVTDSEECVESKVFTLDARTQMVVALDTENVSCFGSSDGKLKAQVTGGTGDYTPEWVNSTATWKYTGMEASDLPADTYTFKVYDEVGCEKISTIDIEQPNLLEVSVTSTGVLCNGVDDGEAYAEIPDGAGTKPYTYTWYKNNVEYASGSRITNLGDGFYRVDVVDKNGCSATDNTVINSSTPIEITITSKQDVQIHGQATGSIELSVTGGTAPLTYLWSGVGVDPAHQTELNQYNLIAGKYYLTVTDNYSCKKELVVEILQPESMVVTSSVKYIDCYGDKAYIELSVTGGEAPYIAEWTSLSGTYTASTLKIYDLDADTYYVEISDQKGNTYSTSFTIPAKLPLEWHLLESSKYELDCHGDKNGYLNLEITGGTLPYNIVWKGPGVSKSGVNNISNIGIGEYSAYISDAKGCTPETQFSQMVTEPDSLIVSADITGNHCYGLSEGAIELTVTGGVPEYTYKWSGFVTDPSEKDQSKLRAGDYHLYLNDKNGCVVDTTFKVSQHVELKASLNGGSNLCVGESMTLYLVVDGTSPWSVEYTDGKDVFTTTVANNLSEIEVSPTESVTYKLNSVIDASGCEAALAGSIPVTVHLVPSATVLSANNDCCLGDAVDVNILFANAGPWYVKYTDGEHEYMDGPFTEQNSILSITPTKLGVTHYNIMSVSNAHCSSDINYEFEVETFYYPNLTVDVPAYLCQPNQIEVVLHPTGTAPWVVSYSVNGQHYEEDVTADGQTITFNPVREDNEFVFDYIKSGELCKTSLGKVLQTTVGMLPKDATVITGPNLVCRNSSFEMHTASIGYADKYVWSLPTGFEIVSGEGSADIVVKADDTAESGVVTVYGSNSCGDGATTQIYVEVTKPITTTGTISAPVYVCENEAMFTISVSEVTGATHYEWVLPSGYTIESGQGTRSILVSFNQYATSSTVSVIPSNPCMEAPAITKYITIRNLPLAEAGIDFNTHCATDARLAAKLNSGSTASWELVKGSATIVTPTSPTSEVKDLLFGSNEFRWEVSDGYCVNFDTVAVTNDNPGITEPEATEITVCDNQVLLRAGEPKFGYGRWKLIAGDGEVQTPNSNETLVTDLGTKKPNTIRWEVYYGACSNTIDVTVISNNLQNLADAGEDGVTTDGTYRLSARMINNSSVQGTWEIVGGAGKIDDIHAENTYVRGLDPGINTIRWTLKGFDCEAYDEVQIRGVDEPEASYMVEKDADCVPFTVFFNNTTLGDATYKWEFGDGGTSELRSPEHTYEKAGTFTVKLTATGKRKTDTYTGTITVYPQPEANFTSGVTQLYIPYATAQFYDATEKTVAWHWDFGDGGTSDEQNPVYKYQESGIYTIKYTVTDVKGCKDTLVAENYIRVSRESFIVFPTAFVPDLTTQNGGMYNTEERRLDIFYPVWRNVDTYTLKIYNQWGTQVFQSDEVLKGWDGYFQGKCADQGTYVFKAEGRYKDGTTFRVSGNVLLIR